MKRSDARKKYQKVFVFFIPGWGGGELLHDVKQKKIALKERFESVKEDSATWGENPMAVGIINKIPATLCPPEMQAMLNNKRSVLNDNDLKKGLIENVSTQIIDKVKGLHTTPNRVEKEQK